MTGSNRRPSACKADALPAELITQCTSSNFQVSSRGPEKMAERTGFEPATPGVTGRYSNQLNYRSAICVHVVGDDGIEPPTLCL